MWTWASIMVMSAPPGNCRKVIFRYSVAPVPAERNGAERQRLRGRFRRPVDPELRRPGARLGHRVVDGRFLRELPVPHPAGFIPPVPQHELPEGRPRRRPSRGSSASRRGRGAGCGPTSGTTTPTASTSLSPTARTTSSRRTRPASARASSRSGTTRTRSGSTSTSGRRSPGASRRRTARPRR